MSKSQLMDGSHLSFGEKSGGLCWKKSDQRSEWVSFRLNCKVAVMMKFFYYDADRWRTCCVGGRPNKRPNRNLFTSGCFPEAGETDIN
jgi:hypothetical protein